MALENSQFSGFPSGFWVGRDPTKMRCEHSLKKKTYILTVYSLTLSCSMDLLFFFEVDLIAPRSGKQTNTHHMQEAL